MPRLLLRLRYSAGATLARACVCPLCLMECISACSKHANPYEVLSFAVPIRFDPTNERCRQQRNNVGFEAFGRPFSTRKGVTTGLNDFYGSRWKASAVLQARNKSGAVMPSSFNMPELAQSSLLALLPRTLRKPSAIFLEATPSLLATATYPNSILAA